MRQERSRGIARHVVSLAAVAGLAFAAFACARPPSAARAPVAPPLAAAPSPAPRPAFSERDLVVTPPGVFGDDVIRFPDELWPIADAVATLLARPEAGGYHVLPAAPIRALWRDAQVGWLPGLSTICDGTPPPARLVAYVHRGASFARVRVDCPAPEKAARARPPCQLDVRIEAPRPTAEDPLQTEDVARLVATLPPGERPARWAERLLATGLVRAPPPEVEGGLGLSGIPAESGRPAISVRDITQSGGWQAAISKATFARHGEAIVACAATAARQPWRDWWVQPYLIEVDAAGSLRRCEFEHVDHLPPPEFGCVCAALRQVPFGAGSEGRRASFVLKILEAPPAGAPRDRLSRIFMLTDRRSTDPSALLGTGEIDTLAKDACLWRATAPLAEIQLPVQFTVGADGRTIRHTAPWPASVPPALRACLDPVLAAARFNCPLSGAAIVDARFVAGGALALTAHGSARSPAARRGCTSTSRINVALLDGGIVCALPSARLQQGSAHETSGRSFPVRDPCRRRLWQSRSGDVTVHVRASEPLVLDRADGLDAGEPPQNAPARWPEQRRS